MKDIKVICVKCDDYMILESNTKGISIYICELCKKEIKVISIGNGGVSG